MVRAILTGAKTQTRRLIVPQPTRSVNEIIYHAPAREWQEKAPHPVDGAKLTIHRHRDRFGHPGDRLWVRETWAPFLSPAGALGIKFAADMAFVPLPANTDPTLFRWVGTQAAKDEDRWRPSIHLPRWACRLVLEVVSVRAARLREIDELESRAEGITSRQTNAGATVWHWDWEHVNAKNAHAFGSARNAFAALWDGLNRESGHGWDVNPWVWVVEFKGASSGERVASMTETMEARA